MATEYRREIGSQVWHFHRHCYHWPTRFDFLVLYDRPHDEKICEECIALGQHAATSGTHHVMLIYRKHQDSTDSEWHFHRGCPLWPKRDYIQIHFLADGACLCPICAKLQAEDSISIEPLG